MNIRLCGTLLCLSASPETGLQPAVWKNMSCFSVGAACSDRKLRSANKGAAGGAGELTTQASNESLPIDFWSRL